MSKQAFPGIKTGGGPLPKIIGTIVVLALLVIVVKHPDDAAAWAKGAATLVGEVVDGVATFLRNVTG